MILYEVLRYTRDTWEHTCTRSRERSNASHSLIGAHRADVFKGNDFCFDPSNWIGLSFWHLFCTLHADSPSLDTIICPVAPLLLSHSFCRTDMAVVEKSIMLGSPNPQRPRVKIKERLPTHIHTRPPVKLHFKSSHRPIRVSFRVFSSGLMNISSFQCLLPD